MLRRPTYLVFAILLLGATVGAQAPGHLAGLINHYTASLDANGPWYIAGDWDVKFKGNSGKADVAIALSMVRSRYCQSGGELDTER